MAVSGGMHATCHYTNARTGCQEYCAAVGAANRTIQRMLGAVHLLRDGPRLLVIILCPGQLQAALLVEQADAGIAAAGL